MPIRRQLREASRSLKVGGSACVSDPHSLLFLNTRSGFLSKASGEKALAVEESTETEDVEQLTTKLEESRIEEVGA